MSSKSKRRVTVDTGNTVSDDAEKRKPSVFERLGPGAGQRKYSEYDSEREKKCRPFLLTGECPYGSTCKYKHVQLSRKSRSREEDTSPENLRLKLKSGQSERGSEKRRDSDTESHDTQGRSAGRSRRDKETEAGDRPDRSSSRSRRDKETKIKSQVVVKKSSGNQDSEDSGDDSESNWFSSLDYKKELELEQKRQQLQRELSQLAEEEVENITIQKKVVPVQSDSDSSPDRGRSGKPIPSPHDKRSTSPGGRGKKEKKKHRTKSPPDVAVRDKKVTSPGPDKSREHKKKHETEDESHKKHKKNKKEKKRSLSPPPDTKGKRKEKGDNEGEGTGSRSESKSAGRQHSQVHSKRSRSSSSDSSVSPPRSKDGKDKGKGKGKKKKSRGGKGDAGSDSDESPLKSKKWLSPLKKTLKLKKSKAGGSAGDGKEGDERTKRLLSPQGLRRGDSRDLLAEDPMPPSRSVARPQGHSAEKHDKKHKGKRSESPVQQTDRGASSKRGDSSRDASFDRRRHSESPALQPDRGSAKRGDSSRDAPFDRRKWEQSSSDRKSGADERPKRVPSPPRQSELYSPSQLDRDSPVQEPVPQQPSRGRQGNMRGDRDAQRDDDGRGQNREGRRGEKFDSRTQTPPQERSGQERFSRRSDGDNFDQYGQDRGRFDADRNRGDFREGRGQGQETNGDRESRGRRIDHFDRGGPLPRDRSRTEGLGRDAAFDRQDSARAGGSRDGRDTVRENEGRDRSREGTRDRGDNRDARDMNEAGGSKFGGSGYGGDGQRRSGQWEAANRSGDWGNDRTDSRRDLAGPRMDDRARGSGGAGSIGSGGSGGRLFRDDGREAGRAGDRRGRDVSADGPRLDRSDSRMDRNDSRLDRDGRLERGENRLDRGDSRNEGRLDRTEGRQERGDSRMDRGDHSLDRIEGRLDRGDSRMDRGNNRMERGDNRMERGDNRMERVDSRPDRGDNRMERHRVEDPVGSADQRGYRQGRGGAAGPSDGRGAMRGMGNRSPVNNRGFDFDRRSNLRDASGGRSGERESRMDRERERDAAGLTMGPQARDRFDPATDFRRDERGFLDDLPESAALRDRRGDDRYMGADGRDLQQRGDRRYDDVRDDRMPVRGQTDDRQGRMGPRRSGPFDYDRVQGPDSRTPDLPLSQRRGPLLPTPVEEASRRGGRGDVFDHDLPRAGREGARDVRDDRSRRDQRDADFGPDLGRDDRSRRDQRDADFGSDLARGGREFPRDGARDPLWERDASKDGRDRDLGREATRDQAARRGRVTPTEDLLPEGDRSRDRNRLDLQRRDRDRSPRREGDKTKESVGQEAEAAKRHLDKKDDGDRAKNNIRDKLEASDARSTRSADDVRESVSQRLKKDTPDGGVGRASSLRGMRDRDSQSDGKRSPARSHGKDQSPLPFSDRRQPKRARSLSPKQRRLTPPPSRAAGEESKNSPARTRSPGRRGADHVLSPLAKTSGRARSRTPVGSKRKLEEDLRSPTGPRTKDDAKSPVSKRPREESRSPGRKTSRHPSPAGSHHSRGSHNSMEPRRKLAGGHKDGEGRFGLSWERDRDSPARRDRDRDIAGKLEKLSDSGTGKGDGDKGDLSRKRGRSPARPQGRGSESADRARKRWRGEKLHPDVELAWQAGFEPTDIENRLKAVLDKARQNQLRSQSRNLAAKKVVLDKRYERERLISVSDDLLIMYDCKRQSMFDWFIRKDRRQQNHFEEDAENCVTVWSAVSGEKYRPVRDMLSRHTAILASAIRHFLDGTWSDTEGDADRDSARQQKSGSSDQTRAADMSGDTADTSRPDTSKTPLSTPLSTSTPVPVDSGKPGRQGRVDSHTGRGSEDRSGQDGRPHRSDDRSEARPGFSADGDSRSHGDLPSSQDGAEDSKDASLKNMLYEDDYEKISSDESDFEADDGEKPTQNIVSVLDIDWASLTKEAAPKQTTGSLLKRFHPATIFNQIGVSRSLAGATLFDKVKALCEEGVTGPDTQKKKEDKENSDKTAVDTASEAGKLDTCLQSDVPVMHMASVRQKRERANLLRNLGPFRRALCARRDLEIRRQLCKVDKVYEQPAVFPSHVMDTDLCKLSIQLFRQGRDFVERKDSECDGKMELAI